MKKNHITNWIILAAGILAVVMGVFVLLADHHSKQTNTEAAEATVIAYKTGEEFSNSLGTWNTVFYPVVRFTAGGKEVEASYSQYYSKEEFPIGETVRIHYDRNDPASFTIDEDNRSGFIAAWEIPAGILLIALAVYRFVGQRGQEVIW